MLSGLLAPNRVSELGNEFLNSEITTLNEIWSVILSFNAATFTERNVLISIEYVIYVSNNLRLIPGENISS
jgi:hypothetical protein